MSSYRSGCQAMKTVTDPSVERRKIRLRQTHRLANRRLLVSKLQRPKSGFLTEVDVLSQGRGSYQYV
jgi:hypothetical protein